MNSTFYYAIITYRIIIIGDDDMKAFKKPLLTFILGILVTSMAGVFAYSYVADQISYTTDKNENIKN